jgi:hypothetical protein
MARKKSSRAGKRWLPKPGEIIELPASEGDPAADYKVLRRRGIAYLIEVEQVHPPLEHQDPGLMAVDRRGNVWTIFEPEQREPWQR